jgi:4-alpha-glucanotransferase
MAVKNSFNDVSLAEWDDDIRLRRKAAMAEYKKKYEDEIGFYKFIQYEFDKQWMALKAYANKKGIEIIGDIPIYVSPDSADFWASPELFQTDADNLPSRVAGCPPDGFSETGQLWGNPLYDWAYHDQTDYAWWIKRIYKSHELYDIIRIDHFRGFDEYYSIPAGEETAKNGKWVRGPGMKLFRKIREKLGNIQIIAEDLGYITDSVRAMVEESGFPNMKIIEFAFDSRDSSGREAYFPYNYRSNCVVYTGTHDNETLAGWLGNILPGERKELRTYLHTESDEDRILVDDCINLAEASVADLCIIPMQDWLGLDNSARINQPGTLGSNWTWRVAAEELNGALAERMQRMAAAYGRCGRDEKSNRLQQ